MNSLHERIERIEVDEPVHIPNLDGTGISETVTVKVPALRDPKNGEIYLDAEAAAILDKVKARHMGLLLPEQIRALRVRLRLTQRQISELLQIGEKTWTRWETGRERPSRVINVLLFALNDGKIDVAYLQSVARRRNNWPGRLSAGTCTSRNPWLDTVQQIWQCWEPQAGIELTQALREAVAGYIVKLDHQESVEYRVESKVTLVSSIRRDPVQESSSKRTTPAGRVVFPTEETEAPVSRLEFSDTLVA